MMEPEVIKTEADYEAALAYVETLMDAAPDSPEEKELELFALLIDTYEAAHYPIDLPDPIEAIKFRMEQQGLQQKDMVPYLGSQSKVSEVLNRKRPLSLTMIRALHENLGIPAAVLLQEPVQSAGVRCYNPQEYPFTEMFNRGYFTPFSGSLQEARLRAASLLNALLAGFGDAVPQPVYCRRSNHDPDAHALIAWQARVLWLASQEDLPDYDPAMVDEPALRVLVQQSYFSTGPQNAVELLNRWGIHLIILPHLPETYLDGASFLAPWGRPVIGLTLRHDRLDNFWFTLLHELAHVRLHLKHAGTVFFDDTQSVEAEVNDPRESEAHAFAQHMLIPADIWEQKKIFLLPSPTEDDVVTVSDEMRISPAILAGRIRWETRNYSRLGSLLGANQVREQFEVYRIKQDQEDGDQGNRHLAIDDP